VKSSLTVIGYLKLSRADASGALALYRPGARREIAAHRTRTRLPPRVPHPITTAAPDTNLTGTHTRPNSFERRQRLVGIITAPL
jgi:hypothetical protein